jgi:hypothetical protein
MLIEKSIDLIGNLTRKLSACSIVSQPTTLSRAPTYCDTAKGREGKSTGKYSVSVLFIIFLFRLKIESMAGKACFLFDLC